MQVKVKESVTVTRVVWSPTVSATRPLSTSDPISSVGRCDVELVTRSTKTGDRGPCAGSPRPPSRVRLTNSDEGRG